MMYLLFHYSFQSVGRVRFARCILENIDQICCGVRTFWPWYLERKKHKTKPVNASRFQISSTCVCSRSSDFFWEALHEKHLLLCHIYNTHCFKCVGVCVLCSKSNHWNNIFIRAQWKCIEKRFSLWS